jgi:hypothetical protein
MRNPGIIMHAKSSPSSTSSSLVTIELALRLLRHAFCTILRGSSKNFRIFVESRLALCVLVAAGKSLLAINAAGGVGVLACCSGVGRVGFAAAHEVVDEGVGVLAGAFGGFLWVLLVSRWPRVVHGRDEVAYTALVQGTFQLVGCVFS